MALLALKLGPGEEVIMPSFTFVSTANCVVLRGAKPVFAEVDPLTLSLDPVDVAQRITSRTRAIIPVHYAGVACDMAALLSLAAEHGLALIEDAAQGVDARWNGQFLGTVGTAGCYSFHATKNITCGEGGAFLTNDSVLAHRAEIVREKGTNRSAFLRGEVDKYTWVSAGSSYILADLLAALLEVQLSRTAEVKYRRKTVWTTYYDGLKPLQQQGRIELASIPPYADSNYHIFFLLASSVTDQKSLIEYLNGKNIPVSFHYVPLHSSPFGRSLEEASLNLPVTESVASRLIRLPLGAHITAEQADYITEHVLAYYNKFVS